MISFELISASLKQVFAAAADNTSMDVLTGVAALAFIAALILVFFYYHYNSRRKNTPEWAAWENDGALDAARAANDAFRGYTPQDGTRGAARTCPVCAARFELGEHVKSKVFPSTGKRDRLLHVLGCKFCLAGERERKCPVCGAALAVDEVLIARIFERPGKSHVHVQGCEHCLGKH